MTPRPQNLQSLHSILAAARRAEDVFGALAGTPDQRLSELKRTFHTLVHIVHPDHCPGAQALAQQAFQLLLRWQGEAELRLRAGVYGTDAPTPAPFVIRSHKAVYSVQLPPQAGDYALLYRCTQSNEARSNHLFFKIARHPRDNPLLAREAKVLARLADAPAAGGAYFPQLQDAFQVADGLTKRQALVFSVGHRLWSVQTIREVHAGSLDPRDAAWIFNRLLEALWHTHRAGLVHGAVLPANLLVDVVHHGLILAEWGYSVAIGQPLTAISGRYESWYPPEVFAKSPATPATDITLAVRCLVYLIGGDPVRGTLPASVPYSLRRFIAGCLLPSPLRRPSDAGSLRSEFDELLEALYGRRTFRPLAMPA